VKRGFVDGGKTRKSMQTAVVVSPKTNRFKLNMFGERAERRSRDRQQGQIRV
jgi:hypothetical protein